MAFHHRNSWGRIKIVLCQAMEIRETFYITIHYIVKAKKKTFHVWIEKMQVSRLKSATANHAFRLWTLMLSTNHLFNRLAINLHVTLNRIQLLHCQRWWVHGIWCFVITLQLVCFQLSLHCHLNQHRHVWQNQQMTIFTLSCCPTTSLRFSSVLKVVPPSFFFHTPSQMHWRHWNGGEVVAYRKIIRFKDSS